MVRNVCAHHSRLYDRTFGTIAVADNRRVKRLLHQQSFAEEDQAALRLAPRLSALHRLTQALDPAHPWTDELRVLLSGYAPAELDRIGFHPGWEIQGEWA